jgi:hypothetical protein
MRHRQQGRMTPGDATRRSGRVPLRPTASTTHNPTTPPATLSSLLTTNPHTRWTEKRGPVTTPRTNPSTHREHLLDLQGHPHPRAPRRTHPREPQSPPRITLRRPRSSNRTQPPPRPPNPLTRPLHRITPWHYTSRVLSHLLLHPCCHVSASTLTYSVWTIQPFRAKCHLLCTQYRGSIRN